MLSGNEDVVYSDWLDVSIWELLVFNDNLGFAIWSQPWDSSIFPLLCHQLADLVGEHMGVWMKGFGVPLICGVSEHESLISSTHILLGFLLMHSSSNVSVLSVNIDDNLAVGAIESHIL